MVFWPDHIRDRMLVLAVAVGLFLASAIVSYGYFVYHSVFVQTNHIASTKPGVTPSPTPTGPPPPPVYTVALLGYGGAGHDGGRLTDTIMIAVVDTGRKRISLVSVPRDSWVALPSQGWGDVKHWKVNAAYAIGSDQHNYQQRPEEFKGAGGGGAFAKYALQEVTGIPIQYFVAVDFTGFKKAIDVLGGVTVNVDRTFDDDLYPIPGEENNSCGKSEEEIAVLTATMSASLLEKEFPCRYEQLHFDRGSQYMDGETALKFVRSRHSSQDGGDFNRARRQRNLLLGVKEKVLALDFVPKIVPFISSLTYKMQMDIPPQTLQEFLSQADEFSKYEIVSIPLTSDENNVLQLTYSADRQSILAPKSGIDDWKSVHEWIDQQLTKESTKNDE